MAGDHDHLHLGIHGLDPFEDFKAIHSGHFYVREHNGRLLFHKQLETFLPILCGKNRVAVCAQE